MTAKKIIGIVAAAIGVLLIVGSLYIKNEVIAGRLQIKKAKESVSKGKTILSLTPVTKGVGDGLTSGA